MAIDTAGNGDIYTTGNFQGTVDFDPGAGVFNLTSEGYIDSFISKLDSSGNFSWAKAAGGINDEVTSSIALSASRNVLVVGYFYGNSISFGSNTIVNADSNKTDIFIAKLDLVTGMESAANSYNIILYPNPTESTFTISTATQFQNVPIAIAIEIYNVLGEKMYLASPLRTSNYELRTVADASEWAPGIYFVKVHTENGSMVSKLVVN
jgi:hypothetical protein